MRCWAVLPLVLVACDASAPPRVVPSPPPRWVYPPASPAWPLGVQRGAIGRGQAPQLAPIAGIVDGDEDTPVRAPLRLPTVWPVPGDGPARAVIYGLEGEQPAIELIDVDDGRLVWRDTRTCSGPIVGVTSDALVCAEAGGTRGLSLDRARSWHSEAPFIAMTGAFVVVGPTGLAVILDAATGDELSRVTLPAGVLAETILASCGDAGRELFAAGMDGTLVRIADAKGGPAIRWSAPIGTIEDVDACGGETVIVRMAGVDGPTLVALTRATGTPTGKVDGVRGWWRARAGDGIEVATATGVDAWTSDLASSQPLALPPLGELLATRGDRRLVRATAGTAVVLDAEGVRAYVPMAALSAALGERAIVEGSWSGSAGEAVRRRLLPGRYRRELRLLPRRPGVASPAELRDLPTAITPALAGAIAAPTTAEATALEIAVDPYDGTTLYAIVGDLRVATAEVARIDLANGAWAWTRADGCAAGTPVGLAIARDVVVCATQGTPAEGAHLVATDRRGQPSWQWRGVALDGVQAAGDTVIAYAAERGFVLDAATGAVRAVLTSDDGGPVRAAAIDLDARTTLVVSFERGRLVARVPAAGMLPAWSIEVRGHVRSIAPSSNGALVELEDGDAYQLELRTGQAWGIAGLGLAWRVAGDVIAGSSAGGDIPGVEVRAPVGRRPLVRRTAAGRPIPVPAELENRPKLWTPLPSPPPLGTSLHVALFEPNGALRAVNDYPIVGVATIVRARGPAGSPVVVVVGGRDVLVLDPRTGDPVQRVALPDAGAAVFSTVVDRRAVAGAVLARPARLVLF